MDTQLIYGVYGLVGVVFLVLWGTLNTLKQRVASLSRLESKVDLLLKQAGVVYDPAANMPPQVLEALHRGQKIEAIKEYRLATGVGLKEAKDAVEKLEQAFGSGSLGRGVSGQRHER